HHHGRQSHQGIQRDDQPVSTWETADRERRAERQPDERRQGDRRQADRQAERDDLPEAPIGEYFGEFLHMTARVTFIAGSQNRGFRAYLLQMASLKPDVVWQADGRRLDPRLFALLRGLQNHATLKAA